MALLFWCGYRKKTNLAIFLSTLFLALILLANKDLKNLSIKLSEHCPTEFSRGMLHALCNNHTKGLVHGNLCSSVCQRKYFKLSTCLHHSTTVVLGGWLNGEKVVLKLKSHWKDPLSADILKGMLDSEVESQRNSQWDKLVLNEIKNSVGYFDNLSADKTLKNLKHRDIKSPDAMASFLSLAGQDEFGMFAVYQELKHFPKLYGHCGQTYAVEKLTPYNKFFPTIIHKIDWQKTKKIALSFLDMVAELENAKGGPLQHCDIQESNFGITDDFEVKLIDVDLILTKEKADNYLAQPNCSKDEDCDFFDCISMCNVKHKKCLSRRITSNLQVVCRDIFKSSWPSTGLFGQMPQQIRSLLMPLLNDCASKRFGYFSFKHKRVKSVLRSLRSILSKQF